MSDLVEAWEEAIRRYAGRGGVLKLDHKPGRLPGLVEAYTPPGLSCLKTAGEALIDNRGFLVVHFEMVIAPGDDENGHPRYRLSRRLVAQGRQAQHRNLYLPPVAQGRGIARSMWSNALALYEELGFVDIVVLKAERIGRYAHAAAGFDFLTEGDRTAVATAVSTVAAALGYSVDPSMIKKPADVLALAGMTDAETLKQAGIVLSPEARFVDPTRIPIGKAALLSESCPEWAGRLDLRPGAESYEQLRAYVGQEAQRPSPDVD